MNIVTVHKNSTPPSFNHILSDRASISSKSSRVISSDEISKPLSSVNSTPVVKDVLGDWIWGNETELEEDNTLLFNTPVVFDSKNIAERRKYFQNKQNRLATTFKTDRVYNLEVSEIITALMQRFLRHLLI